MAKRFTDTNKYKKPFMRSIPGAYKLLWDFLYHDCDHAGIWIVDFQIAQMYIGLDMPITKDEAIKLFNSDEQRIIELEGGKKWFIPSFIPFQYNQLSTQNRAHLKVIQILKSFGLLNDDLTIKNQNKGVTSPLQGAKEQEQEEEQEMEEVGVQGENRIIILPKYASEKPIVIYNLRDHFTITGQLEAIERAGWIKFDEFMKDNPAATFNDPKHLYNAFKRFNTQEQKPNGTPKRNTNSAEVLDENIKYSDKF